MSLWTQKCVQTTTAANHTVHTEKNKGLKLFTPNRYILVPRVVKRTLKVLICTCCTQKVKF